LYCSPQITSNHLQLTARKSQCLATKNIFQQFVKLLPCQDTQKLCNQWGASKLEVLNGKISKLVGVFFHKLGILEEDTITEHK
jgi:hypothetical protein